MDNGNNNQKPNDPRSNKNKNNRTGIILCLLAALVITMLYVFMTEQLKKGATKEVTYNEFLAMLDKKEIESVTLKDNKIIMKPKVQESTIIQLPIIQAM